VMLTLVPGSFNEYATRFFSPSWGFALAWNYWSGRPYHSYTSWLTCISRFNDAVSVASDLTAAQLLLEYWTSNTAHTWIISAAFWVFLVLVNSFSVGAYGELGMQHMLHVRPAIDESPRVLARLSEGPDYYHFHYSRRCCKLWCEPRAPLYRWRELATTRSALRRRLRRLCTSVRDRQLRM
jgi:hypothetical protein